MRKKRARKICRTKLIESSRVLSTTLGMRQLLKSLKIIKQKEKVTKAIRKVAVVVMAAVDVLAAMLDELKI